MPIVYNIVMTTTELKTLSERIVHALELTGTRKSDLAKAIDVRPQIIQFLCTSKTKSSRYTFEIAGALGLNIEWLATGVGSVFPNHNVSESIIEKPLVSEESLLSNLENTKEIQDEWSTELIPVEKIYSDHMVFQMNDSSMEPMIPKNSIIIIDTNTEDMNSLKQQDNIIIAIYKSNKSVIVRKVSIEENGSYLVPINSNLFKKININDDVEFIGKVKHVRWDI